MGTARLGNRDIRLQWRRSDSELTVSGSLAQTLSPKTPRNRGIFRIASGSSRKVSEGADSMAVGGVEGEPVSWDSSLICRENTGKSGGIGVLSWTPGRNSRAIPKSSRRIPCDQEQGIYFDEQKNSGKRSDLESEVRVPSQLFRNCAASRLLARSGRFNGEASVEFILEFFRPSFCARRGERFRVQRVIIKLTSFNYLC